MLQGSIALVSIAEYLTVKNIEKNNFVFLYCISTTTILSRHKYVSIGHRHTPYHQVKTTARESHTLMHIGNLDFNLSYKVCTLTRSALHEMFILSSIIFVKIKRLFSSATIRLFSSINDKLYSSFNSNSLSSGDKGFMPKNTITKKPVIVPSNLVCVSHTTLTPYKRHAARAQQQLKIIRSHILSAYKPLYKSQTHYRHSIFDRHIVNTILLQVKSVTKGHRANTLYPQFATTGKLNNNLQYYLSLLLWSSSVMKHTISANQRTKKYTKKSSICSRTLVEVMSHSEPAADITLEEEDKILRSDTEDSNSTDLNKTITNFGNLVVNSYIETNSERNKSLKSLSKESPRLPVTNNRIESNNKRNRSLNSTFEESFNSTTEESSNSTTEESSNQSKESPRLPVASNHIQSNNKRNRSLNSTSEESFNPAKRLRPINEMFSSMAEAVKANNEGHMVDIISLNEEQPLTKEQSDTIKTKITTELFSKQDISNIKFEPPYFDGSKLRIICKNEESKKWLVDTVIVIKNLLEGKEIGTMELGVPPKMITVMISMPAKSYDPPVFFQIIKAQNSIDTNFWRYKSRTKVVNGRQSWYIAVDEKSFQQLKALDFRPFIGLDRVKFSTQNDKQK